jgi:hypothetical protein
VLRFFVIYIYIYILWGPYLFEILSCSFSWWYGKLVLLIDVKLRSWKYVGSVIILPALIAAHANVLITYWHSANYHVLTCRPQSALLRICVFTETKPKFIGKQKVCEVDFHFIHTPKVTVHKIQSCFTACVQFAKHTSHTLKKSRNLCCNSWRWRLDPYVVQVKPRIFLE